MRDEPSWWGNQLFLIESIKDAYKFTDAQWEALSLDERERKIALQIAQADMNAWRQMTEDERRGLKNLWIMRQQQDAQEVKEQEEDGSG